MKKSRKFTKLLKRLSRYNTSILFHKESNAIYMTETVEAYEVDKIEVKLELQKLLDK